MWPEGFPGDVQHSMAPRCETLNGHAAWRVFPRPISSPMRTRPSQATAKRTPSRWKGSRPSCRAQPRFERPRVAVECGYHRAKHRRQQVDGRRMFLEQRGILANKFPLMGVFYFIAFIRFVILFVIGKPIDVRKFTLIRVGSRSRVLWAEFSMGTFEVAAGCLAIARRTNDGKGRVSTFWILLSCLMTSS